MADAIYATGDRVRIDAIAYRRGEPGTVTESPNLLSRHTVTVRLDSDGITYPFKPAELTRVEEEVAA